MQRKHFDADHEAFAEAFRAFADKAIVPNYMDWERAGITPREVFTEAGKSGFLGMQVPEEYGGGGVDDFRFNQALDERVLEPGPETFQDQLIVQQHVQEQGDGDDAERHEQPAPCWPGQ